MMCRVRLFARAKDLAGTDVVSVSLSAGATVATVRPGEVEAWFQNGCVAS